MCLPRASHRTSLGSHNTPTQIIHYKQTHITYTNSQWGHRFGGRLKTFILMFWDSVSLARPHNGEKKIVASWLSRRRSRRQRRRRRRRKTLSNIFYWGFDRDHKGHATGRLFVNGEVAWDVMPLWDRLYRHVCVMQKFHATVRIQPLALTNFMWPKFRGNLKCVCVRSRVAQNHFKSLRLRLCFALNWPSIRDEINWWLPFASFRTRTMSQSKESQYEVIIVIKRTIIKC